MPVLNAALDAHLEQRPRHLVVDLARLVFCSARGMAALTQASATATQRGTGYAISGTPPWLHRIWGQCWGADQLPIRYTTLAAAITALRARDAP